VYSDLISTKFEDKSYYINIRKALTCGYFMRASPAVAFLCSTVIDVFTEVAHKEGDKGQYMTVKDHQVCPSIGLR
jgi:pre-mRNA-splicing factor ATP-dependent RNA helicase DHX15/PRP43